MQETGVFVGAIRHLGDKESEQLMVQSMSTEAVLTSEIEGEILNRDSVQSSIQRQLGLAASKSKATPAEDGVAKMTVNLYRGFAEPLSYEMLFNWHTMLLQGRRDLKDIGRYRTDKEPMQVVSGANLCAQSPLRSTSGRTNAETNEGLQSLV